MSRAECADNLLRKEGSWPSHLEPGGKGGGSEEADFLAGVIRRPRGSLCIVSDMRRTEPEKA